jgi:GTP pyrophosphokinase
MEGIDGAASARFKLHSSIYEKMQTQNLDFHQVYDICGVRIIVDSVKDCYAVLGVLHSTWTPIPGRFKDYIALPKANLYQSLHTTIVGPQGQRVEFQIRTREMHRVAEEGIAAHWKYKEGDEADDGLADKFEWIRRIVESLNEESDPRNLVDSVKVNLFQDEVFVFTPRGEVKSLPRGATPVDFAFSIHTEVGSHCVGAKVNGKITPLSTMLENGDIVEIITNPHRKPSADWMKFVVTARAKQKIRNWIRQEQKERSLTLGHELLEHELERCVAKEDVASYMKPKELKGVARFFGVQTYEDVLVSVGFGRVSARQVAHKLLPEQLVREREKREKSRLRRLVNRVSRHKNRAGILVKGQDDVLIRYGKCCQPIPGDGIMGFITRGRGVTVHNESCPNIKSLMDDQERLVEVSWGDVDKDQMHMVTLVVEARDRPGVLASLSAAIASCEANISRVAAEAAQDKAAIRLDVQVHDLAQLNDVVKRVRDEKFILSVNRIAPEVAPLKGKVPQIPTE